MTISTRITSTLGVVSTDGAEGVSVERKGATNKGFLPYKQDSVAYHSATGTVSDAGLIYITGSAAVTARLPAASQWAGSMFCFKSTGNEGVQHIVSASNETGGTRAITDGLTKGSRLTLSGGIGNSVTLFCDGTNFTVLGSTSGSAGAAYTLAGA
jgi:hypothetical protein